MRKSFIFAKIEFLKWVTDKRMIILPVLLIFIYSFAIEPLIGISVKMNKPLNILEPFTAVANSGFLMLVLPIAFLTLTADFPKIDNNTLFFIVRTGRTQFLCGQLIKLVLMAVSYIGAVFFGSVIPMLGNGYLSADWSEAVLTFTKVFPELEVSFEADLLPNTLYFQMNTVQAVLSSYALCFLYLLILGLIMLFFTLIKKKAAGFLLCGGIISVGAALCSIRSPLMWCTPMANSITWLHYTKFSSRAIMPMAFSICYLLLFATVFIILSFLAVRKFSYDNISEI